eukprot:symbB.v1.2.016449.t1/scaffold1248.1/size129000/13
MHPGPWLCLAAIVLRQYGCFIGGDFKLAGRRLRRGVAVAAGVAPEFTYTNVLVEDTEPGISIHDITEKVRFCVKKHFSNRRSHQRDGVVHLLSRHTTTALSINEDETRLREDIIAYLTQLAPSSDAYKHNDLHLRPASEKDKEAIDRNWMSQGKGTLEEFMAQEPKNAHAHLLAMTLGQSETIPVVGRDDGHENGPRMKFRMRKQSFRVLKTQLFWMFEIGGELALGQWQSVLMIDLDGPRTRTVIVKEIMFAQINTILFSTALKKIWVNCWRVTDASLHQWEIMEPMQALFTNLAIGAVVVPALLLLFHFGRDPRAILEKLSEMTGNDISSAGSAGSPPANGGKRKE